MRLTRRKSISRARRQIRTALHWTMAPLRVLLVCIIAIKLH